MRNEKRPREYAFEIYELKTKKERVEALKNVPEHFRDLVKKHVEAMFMKRSMKCESSSS